MQPCQAEQTACARPLKEELHMNLPKIDVSSLPDLHTLTGSFGSLFHSGQVSGFDDSIVVVASVVYDVIHMVQP